MPNERIVRINRYIDRLFFKTMKRLSDGTIFVLTGDIPAMWIRDSTWQVLPLLEMRPDAEVCEILGSVSRRQAKFLLVDPYANAFNETPSGDCWHKDFADQSPWVFERKFELDSWSTFLELAISLYEKTGYEKHLDHDFWSATEKIVDLCFVEQNHDSKSYRLHRKNAPIADYLSHDGHGAPVAFTGLVWSGFRPSDDRCIYGYHIPSNAHLSVVLRRLSKVATYFGHANLANRAAALSLQIAEAIKTACNKNGRFPYEIDGLGNAIYLDDPNIPSLLSLPNLGFCLKEDESYQATRSWLLSDAHEYYVNHSGLVGFSSEHTPQDWIWPLSIAMIGLTSTHNTELLDSIAQLECTDGGTGDMHESFSPADPRDFTRPWFSWADMTFVLLCVIASKNLIDN